MNERDNRTTEETEEDMVVVTMDMAGGILFHHTWKFILWLVIGFSPVGFFIPYLGFEAAGLCEGAIGSGVRCSLGPFLEYFADLAIMLYASIFYLGAGLVWLIVCFVVWCFVALKLVKLIQATNLFLLVWRNEKSPTGD